MRNIFGDQGNFEQNFCEHGNSVKVNLGEHLNLFLRNKGTTVNFHREEGNMHPPWETLICDRSLCFGLVSFINTAFEVLYAQRDVRGLVAGFCPDRLDRPDYQLLRKPESELSIMIKA